MSERRRPLPHDFHPPVAPVTVSSTDIVDGGRLGDAQVFDRGNTSPQLSWSDAPEGTKSYAVTCFDPDAPTGSGFWHWVLIDIPANVTELPAGAGTGDMKGLPPGAIHIRNDYGTRDFGGAAPPPGDGPHRYVFTVYAVDSEKLGPDENATPAQVGFMLRFHALGRGHLIGEYENPAAA
ncbi:YbhB/YbcL family Raf kinase inhibitor-like protein [Streptomyces sp. 7-21]|jgi:Raf kinase inhibitor-like YbhB/YbcL family protein|uniref:YbhB/YbcL family Raf kinase inhibitor-like protein n=1 Tax=Streptomyces sp. 7-21 TaxID=2802283 RepID=UPI00191F1917|nr:YbhB/YbcL family Raf kinase inhibitor-like protein [Streptomyces sp. 7-21]MBL1069122.1 YbhB/YbcL family Raf kinase inhibitor-like protein [Streptomyces sp. 7-21]